MDTPTHKSDQSEGSKAKDLPAAGPHDKKELQDEMKTPGTGALNKPGSQTANVGSD